jgi:hypothetical protein
MIEIGECSFPTKKAVEAHVRAILAEHNHGQILMRDNDRFVRELLKRHPRCADVVDCGVAWIWVEHIPGARRFCVRRIDGSIRDFSWIKCIYQQKSFARISGICRNLIYDQKTEFRDRHFRGVCEVCGNKLRSLQCHVDHIPPATFENLLRRWLETVRLDADDIMVISSKDYGIAPKFADPFLAQQWVEYHEINARLRCVCRDCNLSFIRKTSPRNLVRQ